MKKYREFIGKYYESLHGACLSAGLLLLADSFWVLHWPPMLLIGGAVLFSLLFHYAVKKMPSFRQALSCSSCIWQFLFSFTYPAET